MACVQVGANGPHGFLRQNTFEGRHIDTPLNHRSMTNPPDIPLVGLRCARPLEIVVQREKVILDAIRADSFDIDSLKAAIGKSAEIR